MQKYDVQLPDSIIFSHFQHTSELHYATTIPTQVTNSIIFRLFLHKLHYPSLSIHRMISPPVSRTTVHTSVITPQTGNSTGQECAAETVFCGTAFHECRRRVGDKHEIYEPAIPRTSGGVSAANHHPEMDIPVVTRE